MLDHGTADVDSVERHGWIGLGRFNDPITSTAPHIEDATKACCIRLLWQDTAHACGDQLILDREPPEFLLVLSILHYIRTRVFTLLRVLWSRHALSLSFASHHLMLALRYDEISSWEKYTGKARAPQPSWYKHINSV